MRKFSTRRAFSRSDEIARGAAADGPPLFELLLQDIVARRATMKTDREPALKVNGNMFTPCCQAMVSSAGPVVSAHRSAVEFGVFLKLLAAGFGVEDVIHPVIGGVPDFVRLLEAGAADGIHSPVGPRF